MIRLVEWREPRGRQLPSLQRDLTDWHRNLVSEIAALLTSDHAALLATPEQSDAGTAWFAEGVASRRFIELSEQDRARLTTSTGAILSDIRRLAESGAAPTVTAAWPALGTVPDLTHLFAVDGRPVLAGWGFAPPAGGPGPLVAFDDGVAWHPAPRWPWVVYGGTLAALAALGLFAGLLVAPLGRWLLPSPAVCRAAPGDLELLSEQSREQARTDALKEQLAQLREGRGEQALQCPIPRAAAAVPPPVPRPSPVPVHQTEQPPAAAPPTPQQAQICMGDWPIGEWIRVTHTPQGLIPNIITLSADPAISMPAWRSRATRVTACGSFHQTRSISSRQGRLPDGRSVVLNSIVARGPNGSEICYEYWDAYRSHSNGWVRDAAKLVAVVLRTPEGEAVNGEPTDYCKPRH